MISIAEYQTKRAELKELVYALLMAEKARIAATLHLKRHPKHELVESWQEITKVREDMLEVSIKEFVPEMPSADWLLSVKGIGPIMASYVLAFFDLEQPTCSNWWAYAGLSVETDESGLARAVRRKKGQKTSFNPLVRTIAWRIGSQLRQARGFYWKQYERWKAMERNRTDENKPQSDSHVKTRALRKTIKLFLSHAHQKGREALGLPVRAPYIISYPNVHEKIAPPVVNAVFIPPVEDEKPARKKRRGGK